MAPNDGTPISLPLPYTPILFPFSKPGSQGGSVIIRGSKKYMDTWIHSVIDLFFHLWM